MISQPGHSSLTDHCETICGVLELNYVLYLTQVTAGHNSHLSSHLTRLKAPDPHLGRVLVDVVTGAPWTLDITLLNDRQVLCRVQLSHGQMVRETYRNARAVFFFILCILS